MVVYSGTCFFVDEDEEPDEADIIEVVNGTALAPWHLRTSFTDSQLKAFAWAPRATGTLSIVSSSLIIWIIIRDRRTKLTKTRYRLLLGMSLADVVNSFALAMSSAPIPRGTHGTYGAVGTTGTCSAQGFFVQLGFAEPSYCCMLSLYFVLVIQFKTRERTIRRRIEPVMHAVALLYPLGTAAAGLAMDLFNSSATMCWIEPYPHGCASHNYDWQGLVSAWCPCTRGVNAFFYQVMFAGIQLAIMCVVILMSLVIVSCMVWKIERGLRAMEAGRPGGGDPRGRNCPCSCCGRGRLGRRGPRDAHQVKISAMASQAFLYIWGFGATYTFPIYQTIAQELAWTVDFPIHLITYTLLPLQGFWNFWAFMHPRMKFVRSKNPGASMWRLFRLAIESDPGHSRAVSAFHGEFERRRFRIGTVSMHTSRSRSDDSSYDFTDEDAEEHSAEGRSNGRRGRTGNQPEDNFLRYNSEDDDSSYVDSEGAVDLERAFEDEPVHSISRRLSAEKEGSGNRRLEEEAMTDLPTADESDDSPVWSDDRSQVEEQCSDLADLSGENEECSKRGGDCNSDGAVDEGWDQNGKNENFLQNEGCQSGNATNSGGGGTVEKPCQDSRRAEVCCPAPVEGERPRAG